MKSLPRLKTGGQSIFELVVALGIVALVVVALMRVATLSLANINFSKTNSQATRLAEEAMEWLRQERDRNWDEFSTEANGIARCLNSFPSDITGLPPGPCTTEMMGTPFRREATLTTDLGPPSRINAVVQVSWSDNLGAHEVKLDSLFTDWRKQQ